MKKFLVLVLSLILILGTLGCNKINDDSNEKVAANGIEKKRVIVTNYPLFFFTKQIVGDELN